MKGWQVSITLPDAVIEDWYPVEDRLRFTKALIANFGYPREVEPKVRWVGFDHGRMSVEEINLWAQLEGWGLFDSFGSEQGPFQLQQIDDMDLFEDDAWTHVWGRAAEGSHLHQEALERIREIAPAEYYRIQYWCLHGVGVFNHDNPYHREDDDGED